MLHETDARLPLSLHPSTPINHAATDCQPSSSSSSSSSHLLPCDRAQDYQASSSTSCRSPRSAQMHRYGSSSLEAPELFDDDDEDDGDSSHSSSSSDSSAFPTHPAPAAAPSTSSSSSFFATNGLAMGGPSDQLARYRRSQDNSHPRPSPSGSTRGRGRGEVDSEATPGPVVSAATTGLTVNQTSDPARPCKFAKAGCPFTGTSSQVAEHETSYCTPLYTQLAHYKTVARHCTAFHATAPSSFSPEDALALSSRQQDTITSQAERIARLQNDLEKAQDQLEEEKRLRSERLRRANERVLELMSQSELGEGKVEVYKVQLHAERELREKLEEELDALRGRLRQGRAEDSERPDGEPADVGIGRHSRQVSEKGSRGSTMAAKRSRMSQLDEHGAPSSYKRTRKGDERPAAAPSQTPP